MPCVRFRLEHPALCVQDTHTHTHTRMHARTHARTHDGSPAVKWVLELRV